MLHTTTGEPWHCSNTAFCVQQARVSMHSTTGCHVDMTRDLKMLDGHSCCKPLSPFLSFWMLFHTQQSMSTSYYPMHIRKCSMAAHILTIHTQMHMVYWYSGTSLFKRVDLGSIFETAIQCIVNCWPSWYHLFISLPELKAQSSNRMSKCHYLHELDYRCKI